MFVLHRQIISCNCIRPSLICTMCSLPPTIERATLKCHLSDKPAYKELHSVLFRRPSMDEVHQIMGNQPLLCLVAVGLRVLSLVGWPWITLNCPPLKSLTTSQTAFSLSARAPGETVIPHASCLREVVIHNLIGTVEELLTELGWGLPDLLLHGRPLPCFPRAQRRPALSTST